MIGTNVDDRAKGGPSILLFLALNLLGSYGHTPKTSTSAWA